MNKLGISPGVTNLLIGLRLHQLRGSRRRDLVAWDINLCESVRDATPV